MHLRQSLNQDEQLIYTKRPFSLLSLLLEVFFKGYYFCCVAQQDLEFLKQVLMSERKGFISLTTGAAAGSSAAG